MLDRVDRVVVQRYGRPGELLVLRGRPTGHKYQPTNARKDLRASEPSKRVYFIANPQLAVRVRVRQVRLRVQVLAIPLQQSFPPAVWKHDVMHPARHLNSRMN